MRFATSRRSSTADAFGWCTSLTTACRHPPLGASPPASVDGAPIAGSPAVGVSVTLVTLLEPRVAPVVVAVALPEARLVMVEQGQPGDPLGALPEVEVRDQQSHRAAVLDRKRPPLVGPDDPGPAVRH